MRPESLARDHDSSLSTNGRELPLAILRDAGLIPQMSGAELARHPHSSHTTLTRLLRKLGINTYAEFKFLVSQQQGEDTACDFDGVAAAYHRMIDQLLRFDHRDVCQAIPISETVHLYGSENEQKTIARKLKRALASLGKVAVLLFDEGEVLQAGRSFGSRDLFVAVSLSGEGAAARRVVRIAQEYGIATLSLTRWQGNTLSRDGAGGMHGKALVAGRGGLPNLPEELL